MLFHKMRPFALAFLLMLLFGTLALAQQPNNRQPTDDQKISLIVLFVTGGCVCSLVYLAMKIAILVFVYRDAQARGAEPMLWLVLCIFTDLLGLIIWLIVRPPLKEPTNPGTGPQI